MRDIEELNDAVGPLDERFQGVEIDACFFLGYIYLQVLHIIMCTAVLKRMDSPYRLHRELHLTHDPKQI